MKDTGAPKEKRFASFDAFYPFYLAEHSDIRCRRMHFAGTALVICTAIYSLTTAAWWALAFVPLFGYGFAWVGHFVFQKNRPATFQHPWYSIAGDFVMFRDVIVGKLQI
jgi:hypothetical protein